MSTEADKLRAAKAAMERRGYLGKTMRFDWIGPHLLRAVVQNGEWVEFDTAAWRIRQVGCGFHPGRAFADKAIELAEASQ